jgi:hypothetical protein
MSDKLGAATGYNALKAVIAENVGNANTDVLTEG